MRKQKRKKLRHKEKPYQIEQEAAFRFILAVRMKEPDQGSDIQIS